jgi:uncharacterized protein YecT (DUF1311 family)
MASPYNRFAFGIGICSKSGMQRSRGISLSWLLIPLLIVLSSLFAENQNTELKETDAELNVLYQGLMNSLSPSNRERLRTAERAWISFGEKNEVAFRATSEIRGLSPSQLTQFRIGETRARCDQLRRMFSSNEVTTGASLKEVQFADTELNKVYKQAIAVLSSAEETRLREAQRAWLDFYNASRSAASDVALMIISHRTEQLREFYLEEGTGLNAFSPKAEDLEPSDTEKRVDPTIPDPFERARVKQPPR